MSNNLQQKTNKQLRIKYGVYIGLYTAAIFLIGILMFVFYYYKFSMQQTMLFSYLFSAFGVLFFLSTIWLSYFAAKEITKNFAKKQNSKNILPICYFIFVSTILGIITAWGPLFTWYLNDPGLAIKTYCSLLFGMMLFIFLFTAILSYVWFYIQTKNIKKTFVGSSITFLVLAFFFCLYYNIYCCTWYNLFFLFISCVSFDTFAYFGGTKFGKTKMAPKISPNKTWEGFGIGYGSTIALLLAIGLTIFFIGTIGNLKNSVGILTFGLCGSSYQWGANANQYNIQLPCLLVLILVMPLIGCAGDLLFSKYKRVIGIKDFNNWIPGHGGLLDRIDSLSLAFVSFTFTFILISLCSNSVSISPLNGMWAMILPFPM